MNFLKKLLVQPDDITAIKPLMGLKNTPIILSPTSVEILQKVKEALNPGEDVLNDDKYSVVQWIPTGHTYQTNSGPHLPVPSYAKVVENHNITSVAVPETLDAANLSKNAIDKTEELHIVEPVEIGILKLKLNPDFLRIKEEYIPWFSFWDKNSGIALSNLIEKAQNMHPSMWFYVSFDRTERQNLHYLIYQKYNQFKKAERKKHKKWPPPNLPKLKVIVYAAANTIPLENYLGSSISYMAGLLNNFK